MITRENVKYYVCLISKKLRVEEFDNAPTYYYDYKIKLHETGQFHSFYIEINDLEKDFKDNDYNFILHYVNQLKKY